MEYNLSNRKKDCWAFNFFLFITQKQEGADQKGFQIQILHRKIYTVDSCYLIN